MIFLLEDDESIRKLVVYALQSQGFEAAGFEKPSEFWHAMSRKLPELETEPQDNGVARLYRLPGAQGRIGLISPVSSHFCGTCNRIRLTADGKIKPCLHSDQEFPIKGLDYDGVLQQMRSAILAKPACHGERSAQSLSHAGRSMNQIGG